MLAACRTRRVPVALSMAGGYGRDIEVTVSLQLRTLRAAVTSWSAWQESRLVDDSIDTEERVS